MRCAIVTWCLGLLLVAGCQGEPAKPKAPPAVDQPDPQGYKLLKLVVNSNGELTANGQPMSLEQLELRLPKVRAANGVIWYYRENPDDTAHPNAMKVVQLAAKQQLLVKRAEQADFSDLEALSKPAK